MYQLDIDKFRTVFEFGEQITDEQISYAWENTLLILCMPYSSKTQRLYELYTAHQCFLSLARKGTPGYTLGEFTTSSSSVGNVSVSKLDPRIANTYQYELMQTPYGRSFLDMLKVLSTGPIHIAYQPTKRVLTGLPGFVLPYAPPPLQVITECECNNTE